ncbi:MULTISPECIES: bifunctional phosphopantothenoylcysteine decarboxylase/phosphopantothenate--cysteine ligase CoaBC [unclassified Veillonella]|uniref:bifunctional phosphopantothenoylcysteine decarboxylase/phosphopantothenate--cysteine ligase CoaBC n=1 Tax=unclassified Veillonella TaxID=2630086 RepID=UPI000F8E0372|nr:MULTISPECIES: bifunctional phosphopantothenoylcysteine decarboxylase/phosphopantothenate--cysteine ligase CoaBC [unclassified Veillonella]
MKGKHIVVGVTAGIATYKAVDLVSRLYKAGAEVKVVMTRNATKFVSPLVFGEISKHKVAVEMFENVQNWNVEHIAYATWADAYVIAPATANMIAKMSNGIADDMLSTQLLATTAPVFVCPAMNSNMYTHPTVQENLTILRGRGVHVLEPDSGLLACGVEGKGRLPDPQKIMDWVDFHLGKTELLQGKTVIVSAGGTQEAIDPVRYITNRSSGKMGYAVALKAAQAGAKTILVSAPTDLAVPIGVERIIVCSATEMKEAIDSHYDSADAVIMAAAVADYRVAEVADNKIKKQETMTLELVKNPDILASLGERKQQQKLIGFAAETQDVITYGKEKVRKKNLDMLVANDVSKLNAGFDVDTNEVTFIYPGDQIVSLPNMSKLDVAERIIQALADL